MQENENMRSNPADQDVKRTGAHRYISQNTTSHNHKMDQDQTDPYNYVLESPKDEPNETREKNPSSHRKTALYQEENVEGEGIDIEGISVRKRNMVRQT